MEVAAKETARVEFTMQLPNNLTPGRHVFAVRAVEGSLGYGADAFVAVDVREW